MSRQKVESLVKLRDAFTMASEALNDYISSLAPKEVMEHSEKEDIFNVLSWEQQSTEKLGKYDTADQSKNNPEKFKKALEILKFSTIKERFHGQNYAYSYWIYNSRIYRQKLKP